MSKKQYDARVIKPKRNPEEFSKSYQLAAPTYN